MTKILHMKKAKAELRKIISFVLSVAMFFAVISFPHIAEAKTYGDGDWAAGQVFFPGDIIDTPAENQWMIIRFCYDTSNTWTQFSEAWGGTGDSYYFDVGGLYEEWGGPAERAYHKSFTFPQHPDGISDSVIYIAKTDFQKLRSFDTFLMDVYNYDVKTKKVRGLEVYAYKGFAVEFYNKNGSRILDDKTYFVFRNGDSVGVGGQTNPANYPLVDNPIGWSTNPNYMSSPDSGDVFIKADKGENFTVPSNTEVFEAMYNKAVNGTLKLYPVYYKDSNLSVSVSDCTEEETLNYTVTSDRPAGRDNKSVEFRKFITSDQTVEISEVPTEPGQYRIIVKMDKESLSYNNSGSNLQYIPYNEAIVEEDFTISYTHSASVTQAPVAKPLTYDGSEQELVFPGIPYDGEMVYSFSETGSYSTDIPVKKDAGSYFVWYKAKGINRPDSDPVRIIVSINQKEVGLDWSETEFIYDGEEHCPSVTLSGICSGDTCTATVSGANSEKGTYTATVTEVSDYNYCLPSDRSISFSIVDRADKTAKISEIPQSKILTYNSELQDLITAGRTADGSVLVYSLSEDGEYSSEIPKGKNAGEYTVWYKALANRDLGIWFDSDPSSVNVTINPKTVGLEWSDDEFEYDGNEHCPSVVLTGVCEGDVCNVTVSGGKTDAGNYIAKATQLSNSNYTLPDKNDKTFCILPASSFVNVSPEGKELKYNGKEQELIIGGSAIGGIIVYSLDKDGTYSSVIPKGKNAQEYTVWYKSEGDSNHTDSAVKSLNIKIKTETIGLEWSKDEFTYDGEEHCPTAVATGLFEGDECLVTVSGAKKEAGTFTAKAVMLSNSNYALPDNTEKTFTILETGSSIKTYPTAYELTYNGKNQALVIAGETKDGEMVYSLLENGTYSSEIPTGKDAKEYTVWYKVIGDTNHSDSKPQSIKVTIAQKIVGLEWSKSEFFYDKKMHCPEATATGVCDGDTCEVTVSGAQKEIGIYTAVATSLSNSNYKLPKDNSIEFSILNPKKLKGEVSVSMSGYIYGGRASTPTISSTTNDTSKASIVYKQAGNSDTTYSTTVPSEVGDYVVKVILPENEEYNACSATAGFSISYLPVPENSYSISGTKGDNGWYISDVTITPTAGYEISYGDRNHFSGNPVKIANTVSVCVIYIKDAQTGEQTSMISVGNFQIDSDAPVVVGMDNNGLYFADENGVVKIIVKDANISRVTVEGTDVSLKNEGNGNMSFTITVGRKKEKTSFSIYDMAGNKTDFAIYAAPHWAESGEVIEGNLYLEGSEKYVLPAGTTWTVDGDETKYNGGMTFYVVNEGDYVLRRN